jgi:hypothetical protein
MKVKWKPDENQEYYIVDEFGGVSIRVYKGLKAVDKAFVRVGNCYRQKTDAVKASARIKRIFRENYITDVEYKRRSRHGAL